MLDFITDKSLTCHRLEEDSQVFANSSNFHVYRQIDDDLSDFANKAVVYPNNKSQGTDDHTRQHQKIAAYSRCF
ncbi:hypothetical protein DLE54_05785 [Psychrobacter sp. YP14]|uniref:hypothetical protein n=1 Tax=Psychrobacter sp. YP14 TaxID=2203895 RepID=UPI000D7EA54F|nr:hypothetical protein [Psychrobacter sp. YP14]AWT49084.1 hypothetical protein DLE54_05785 [Psychrobacter sp. YP14]